MQKSKDRRVTFGPPRAYWTKTLDNFRELTPQLEAAVEAIRAFPDYSEEGDEGEHPAAYSAMILAGPTGTGKTHCLAGIYNHWLELGFDDCIFRRCIDLGREMAAAKPAHLIDLMRRYGDGCAIESTDENDSGCRTLLLDDLGVGCDLPTVDVIIEILDRRTSSQLETVITTNLTRKELRAMFGERGYSRLMHRCKWVPMPGADFRLKDAA